VARPGDEILSAIVPERIAGALLAACIGEVE
jgi:hypothetical protein